MSVIDQSFLNDIDLVTDGTSAQLVQQLCSDALDDQIAVLKQLETDKLRER